jgi:hypothetical protein
MPYQFTEYPREPEPQLASSRGTRPPGKGIGVGVLDPPGGSSSELAPTRLHFPWWLAIMLLVGSVIILLVLSGRL